jgi:tetratricopeptide (TPR) repeat protein
MSPLYGGDNSLIFRDMDPALTEVYNHIFRLDFAAANRSISELQGRAYPDPLLSHAESTRDFLKVFIGEGTVDYEEFKDGFELRMDRAKSHDESSAFSLYSQSEMYLHKALLEAKFGNYVKALFSVNRAYKLINLNETLHPDFIYSQKSKALIHILVGSMNGMRKNLVQWFTSLEGSIEEGVREYDRLYDQCRDGGHPFELEVLALRAHIALHVEKNLHEARKYIDHPKLLTFQSPLIDFLRASVYLKLGMNDEAIASMEHGLQVGSYPFHYLEFMLGKAKLNRMDHSASTHLHRFLASYEGKNYRLEALQKLAWSKYILDDDIGGYIEIMKQIHKIAHAYIGEDKLALAESLSDDLPDPTLLKARLLFDGGYLSSAYVLIEEMDPGSLEGVRLVEYYYRKARILQEMNEPRSAMKFFGHVIHLGREYPEYYACNASLQLGVLFHEVGNYDRAQFFFEMCTEIEPSAYAESLHQQARWWMKMNNEKREEAFVSPLIGH